MAENRDFKGVWIPKDIWLDKSLNALEKVILAEIDSLDNEEYGHCTASNEYFSEFCQCSKDKVTRAVRKLVASGYIEVVSFNGRTRVLKSNVSKCGSRVRKNTRQSQKISEAESEKIGAININNNTSINNTLVQNNLHDTEIDPVEKKKQEKLAELKENFEKIYAIYPKKKGKTNAFTHYKGYVSKQGRKINDEWVRLTNRQIYAAVKRYCREAEGQHGTDYQFWKNFDTLMNRDILDYVREEDKK